MMQKLSRDLECVLWHHPQLTLLAGIFSVFHLGTYHLSNKYKMTLTLVKQTLFFSVEVQLSYSVVSVSSTQESDSDLYTQLYITADSDYNHEIALWKENFDKPRQHIKKQRLHFADKNPDNQSYDFSGSHVQM